MPKTWTLTSIDNVTAPVDTVNPTSRPNEEFFYLDISSIDNEINKITDPKVYSGSDAPSRARQHVFADDVLFSTVRTYLRNIALVPEQYDGQIASTGFSVLRPNQATTGKYLLYYVLTEAFLEELVQCGSNESTDRVMKYTGIVESQLPESTKR